jgi:hypothetical protein
LKQDLWLLKLDSGEENTYYIYTLPSSQEVMHMQNTEHAFVHEVLSHRPKGFKAKVNREIKGILGGKLISVLVDDEKGKFFNEDFVFVDRLDKIRLTLQGDDEVFAWLSALAQKPKATIMGLKGFEIVAAIIAIVITLAICAIVLVSLFTRSGPTAIDIPDVLSAALTTILGFYFGSRAGKASESEVEKTDLEVARTAKP